LGGGAKRKNGRTVFFQGKNPTNANSGRASSSSLAGPEVSSAGITKDGKKVSQETFVREKRGGEVRHTSVDPFEGSRRSGVNERKEGDGSPSGKFSVSTRAGKRIRSRNEEQLRENDSRSIQLISWDNGVAPAFQSPPRGCGRSKVASRKSAASPGERRLIEYYIMIRLTRDPIRRLGGDACDEIKRREGVTN